MLTKAYREYTTRLEKLLYEHDPYGTGAAIDAPSDEYADAAARIAAALSHEAAPGDLERAIDELFPGSGPLKEALIEATLDFRKVER